MLGFLLGIECEHHRLQVHSAPATGTGLTTSSPTPSPGPAVLDLGSRGTEPRRHTDEACGSDADSEIWRGGGRGRFRADNRACGSDCWGKPDCVRDCIAGKEGYSGACAACFGGIASCTVSHCFFQCLGSGGTSCDACAHDNCSPGFNACSGLVAPSAVADAEGAAEGGAGGDRLLRAAVVLGAGQDRRLH